MEKKSKELRFQVLKSLIRKGGDIGETMGGGRWSQSKLSVYESFPSHNPIKVN